MRISPLTGFVAMSAALLSFFAAAGVPTPLLPLYEHEWGFPPYLLTIAFGVYALALIASLLVAGSLSDHVGRRPVLIGALALELVAMIVLLLSPSIGWLIVGRVLQGAATGIASSTFGAAIVELAPERFKKVGAVMSSLATTAGLGLGTLFAGIVAATIPASAATVAWTVLVVVMAAGTVFALLVPETSTRRPGALASLVPRVSVPIQARRLFAASAPGIAGVFLGTAFFLGLVPTVLTGVFGVASPIIGALMNFVMFATGTTASALTSGVPARRLRSLGSAGMTLGAVLIIGALATRQIDVMWIAAVVSGVSTGVTFSGSIRGLVPEVQPHERAQLLAATFTLAYLTLGGSAILAGFVATAVGVEPMAVGFATVLAAVSLAGGLLTRSGRTPAPAALSPAHR